jgi:hypothetical protein
LVVLFLGIDLVSVLFVLNVKYFLFWYIQYSQSYVEDDFVLFFGEYIAGYNLALFKDNGIGGEAEQLAERQQQKDRVD